MQNKHVCVTVELDHQVWFSRYHNGDVKGGVQPIELNIIADVKSALEQALLAISELIPVAQTLNESSIEIKLSDKTVFSQTIPKIGTPFGTANSDIQINFKVKEILENALGWMNVNLKIDN